MIDFLTILFAVGCDGVRLQLINLSLLTAPKNGKDSMAVACDGKDEETGRDPSTNNYRLSLIMKYLSLNFYTFIFIFERVKEESSK